MKYQDEAKMLISFFNMTTGSRFKFTDKNIEKMASIIDSVNGNVYFVRKKIKEFAQEHEGAGLMDFYCWKDIDNKTPVEAPVPVQTASSLDMGMQIITNTVAQMVAQMKTEEIQSKVIADLHAKIDNYILDTYGKIEKTVTLVSEFGKHEMRGVQHKKFDTVLKFVANDEPVYLSGPAGSGKNVICKQVAEALGLEFYFTNAVTQEYKLTGFTDANGRFHESQFYKAFKDGGVFMLDEMDASIPEVLIILNAAIANRYFDFPAPIGKIEANPNFRVIAAGNTLGYGADSSYVGRNTLDAASLDRFAVIQIDYDDDIEMNVTDNNAELVAFCNEFRKAANKSGIQITVSYRAMSRMAKMEKVLDKIEMIQTCLIKGLEKDDVNVIKSNLNINNQYSMAFSEACKAIA